MTTLVIPNTLNEKSGQVQLGLLDDNFTYLTNAINPLVNAISIVNTTNLLLGSNGIVATTSPINISLGGTYSSVAGQKPKLSLWSDGAGTTFGLGVSLHQQDYIVPSDAYHVFYIGTSEYLRLTPTTLTVNGNTVISGALSSTYLGFNFGIGNDTRAYTPTNKTRLTFSYTGGLQTFTVPAGVNYIYAKVWGAGGGGGNQGGWAYPSTGGSGGYSKGLIPVTPGTTLYIVVGQAGQMNYAGSTVQGFGGGGGLYNNTNNIYSGSGGGYSGIFNAAPTPSSALLMAGGGGGGGASRMAGNGCYGGAGGGITAQGGGSRFDAKFAMAGGPGTQSAGGAAGTGGSGPGAGGTGIAGVGGSFYGGTGGTSNGYGGGGGGGYFGGGGGCYSESNTMAGGGGGSGYVNPSILFGASYTGYYDVPPFITDPDFPDVLDPLHSTSPLAVKYAYGGQGIQYTAQYTNAWGGSGYVVIYY